VSQTALTSSSPTADVPGRERDRSALLNRDAAADYCPHAGVLGEATASACVPWSGSRSWWTSFALDLSMAYAALFVLSDILRTRCFPNHSMRRRRLLLTPRDGGGTVFAVEIPVMNSATEGLT
jgi:hypothetical protein